jgi:hypothetical protein
LTQIAVVITPISAQTGVWAFMFALATAACAFHGVGGALRARPKLHQSHQTANDARLHTMPLGAVHSAARHAAPLAQEPALLTDDEKVLASLRAAGLGNQTGFTKNNDESTSLDFVFRGHASGERPGFMRCRLNRLPTRHWRPCPCPARLVTSPQAPRSLQKSLHWCHAVCILQARAYQGNSRASPSPKWCRRPSAAGTRSLRSATSMTTIRSVAVSRRAIEPSSDPGLRTAAHSCSQLRGCAVSLRLRPGCPPPPSPPPPTHPAPRTHPPRTSHPATPHASPFF